MRGLLFLSLMSSFCASALTPTPSIPVRGIGPDLAESSWPSAYARPVSMWQVSEKAVYADLLAKEQFDILVVPVQVQYYAFSRATRSLMTAQLAAAIAASGNYRVPDPYLVARALGEGERRIQPSEVYELAKRLDVKRIVWSYTGYSMPQRNIRFSIQHQDRLDTGFFDMHLEPVTHWVFHDLIYSDEHPPFEAFQQKLPEALKSMGMEPAAPAAKVAGRGLDAALPSSLLDIAKGSGDAARDAQYFQLLAALTPAMAERARERFGEKSLLSVYRLAETSPGYNYLKARALMVLGERAAAVKTLGPNPTAIEEKHLLALLNGDLPAVQRLAPQVKAPLAAFLARLDANSIGARYGAVDQEKSRASAQAIKLPSEPMKLLAERAFTDWSLWEQHDNIALKRILDREMPVAGFSLDQIGGGTAAVADAARLRSVADLSVLDHVRRLLAANAVKPCCLFSGWALSGLDYLDFFESVASDNLIRRARFLVEIQGAADSALRYIAGIESVYNGHPQVTLARARAETQLAKRASGAARQGYYRSAYANALNAWFWEQGQTRTAADAFDVGSGYSSNPFASDLPFRSFYPTWDLQTWRQLRNARGALNNSMYDVDPLRRLQHLLKLDGKPEEFEKVMQSVEGRFAGNPELADMKAEIAVAKGDTVAAAGFYRDSIKSNPAQWKSYTKLGTLLLEDGRSAEAAKVFMSYPGFGKHANENRVGISNAAYEAGSMLFWSGNLKQAEPLYRIAAGLNTGSDASMSSSARLALLERDFAEAAGELLNRAQRYNSVFAYRDYIGMLHALGHEKEAWEGFEILSRQIPEPQLWETVLVGQRKQGLSVKQIADWSMQDPARNTDPRFSYQAMNVLRAGVTDRKPGAELPALIAQLDRQVWRLEEGERQVVRGGSVVGPDAPTPSRFLAPGVFERSKKAAVKSDLVYFAEAYSLMREGKSAAASTLLQEAATLYDVRNVRVGYFLPYLAFAAAKQGMLDGVEKLLARFPVPQQRFDYFLARAAIAGLTGKTKESLQFLTLARHRRPFTEHRPLYTEYQYAEICEWLFDATKDTKYAAEALAWAKANQAAQPWFAWPYAVEARLATNPADRKRAIGMTQYLDRNSERLSAIPAEEVKGAVADFERKNPFVVRPKKGETT
jgi:hypothetical protein